MQDAHCFLRYNHKSIFGQLDFFIHPLKDHLCCIVGNFVRLHPKSSNQDCYESTSGDERPNDKNSCVSIV